MPSSRRPNPRANSHQRGSRTSALSPPNRGDQLPSNSLPTNTSVSQLLTSHHRRSPTETPSTVSRWDQCASTRCINQQQTHKLTNKLINSHTNIHGNPKKTGPTKTETLEGLNDHRTTNIQHNGPVEPARDRETRGRACAERVDTSKRFTLERL